MSNDQVIIDLSHALSIDLTPYPGDPPFTIRELANVPNEGYRLNLIQGTAHTGTHVDVPAHFIHLGQKVDSFPVEFWFGQAMVVSVVGIPVINFSDLPALDLHQIDFLSSIPAGMYNVNHPPILNIIQSFILNWQHTCQNRVCEGLVWIRRDQIKTPTLFIRSFSARGKSSLRI
ncbi:MAG: cyclase family protein [Saprospiraceae bacterium]|nr:cyclase family protein [Saprospiraceae bacterium]